jgi:hypothetical protein
MGRAIFYCNACSSRLNEDDLEAGKAFKTGDRFLCGKCATPQDRASATPSTRKQVRAAAPSTRKGSSARVARPEPEPAPEPMAPETGRKRWILIGAGVGGAVVIVVLVLALRGGKAPPPPTAVASPPPAAGEKTALPPKERPEETQARLELSQAKEFIRKNPDELARAHQMLNGIVMAFEGTPAAAEAKLERARVGEAIQGVVDLEAAKLDAELQGKEPGVAREILRKADGRHPFPAWKLAVGKRLDDLRQKAVAKREEATEAATPVTPVPVPAPAPPPTAGSDVSEELKAYRSLWAEAVKKAAARDHAGAAAELRKVSAGLKDEAARREAARDEADLAAAGALLKDGLAGWIRRGVGSVAALRVRTGDGSIRRLSGSVSLIDAERVELLGVKESVFAEWGDVTPASIARSVASEPRLAALASLLEGDVEAARETGVPLEEKWLKFAEGAKALLPKPDPAERSARDLFYAAEREYRSMETLASAAEKYRSLKTDFAGSGVSRLYLNRILRRSEAGKEYVFAPSDFVLDGTFRLAKSGRIETERDVDPDRAIDNTAVVEFAVLPGTAYRMWLLAGGCCEETFQLLWQASELTDVHPTTKKKISCEPGGSFASALKHGIRNLKKTHAAHSPKKEPKRPERWEWIEVKLPKYAAPGSKKAVFMTDQGGFGIGGAFVSSTATRPPAEAAWKDLEKARMDERPPAAHDPDLIGYWPMDEGSGANVADASGNGRDGKLSGAEWCEGKLGGGLKFNGSAEVVVPDDKDLRVTGDFTVMFWVRKDGPTPEWARIVGKGDPNRRTFGIWWFPGDNLRVKFQQVTSSGKWFDVDSAGTLAAGKWQHVAATVKGNHGTVYMNGVKDAEGDREAAAVEDAAPFTFGKGPIHVGLIGALDELRLYRRALTLEEVKSIFEMGR